MRLVSEQHHHAVNADSKSAGRRQPILEGQQIVLVHGVSLFVSGLPRFGLGLEPLPLVIGVVQLAECIGILRAGNHQLEPVRQPGVVGIAS